MTCHGFLFLIPCVGLIACADPAVAPAPPPPAAIMLGEWQYQRPATAGEKPSLGAGLLVTIVIDSVEGAQFVGRVTSWFAGDVGVPIDRFGPVTGSLFKSAVTMQILPRDLAGTAHVIRGYLQDNVIVVVESWLGPNVGSFPNGGQFVRLH